MKKIALSNITIALFISSAPTFAGETASSWSYQGKGAPNSWADISA